MSEHPAVDRVLEELNKLLEAAPTQEERTKILALFLERIHDITDDEGWAVLRKIWDAGVAKRNAH
jgi:hypothetical protein